MVFKILQNVTSLSDRKILKNDLCVVIANNHSHTVIVSLRFYVFTLLELIEFLVYKFADKSL